MLKSARESHSVKSADSQLHDINDIAKNAVQRLARVNHFARTADPKPKL
jgi:hypothetical protein